MKSLEWSGELVSLELGDKDDTRLDGFLCHGARRSEVLFVFVHGMYSNFYSSRLKKQLLKRSVVSGMDCLTINNRGAENDVKYEVFEDCLKDLDATLDYARQKGYRKFILLGHSTGCQKITFYQARRKRDDVLGVGLLAPGDDYAIARREAGAQFNHYVRKAKALVAAGDGHTLMPWKCSGFSARRYLSVADPTRNEAKVFDYEGRLFHFQQLRCPVLLMFGDAEQYACLPVTEMHEILRDKSKSAWFSDYILPGADHSFHDCEPAAVRCILKWARTIERLNQ